MKTQFVTVTEKRVPNSFGIYIGIYFSVSNFKICILPDNNISVIGDKYIEIIEIIDEFLSRNVTDCHQNPHLSPEQRSNLPDLPRTAQQIHQRTPPINAPHRRTTPKNEHFLSPKKHHVTTKNPIFSV